MGRMSHGERPPQRGVTRLLAPVRQHAVTAVAVAVAAAGLLVAARLALPGPATAESGQAEVDGLATAVGTASWMDMKDMNAGGLIAVPTGTQAPASPGSIVVPPLPQQGGYQMPAQMMPGMPPEGQARLTVPVTLRNTTDKVRTFDIPAEFVLRGGAGDKTRELYGDTIGSLPRLAPGNAVTGVLYFDLEPPQPGDPPLYLQWTRSGKTVRLSLSPTGKAVPHEGH